MLDLFKGVLTLICKVFFYVITQKWYVTQEVSLSQRGVQHEKPFDTRQGRLHQRRESILSSLLSRWGKRKLFSWKEGEHSGAFIKILHCIQDHKWNAKKGWEGNKFCNKSEASPLLTSLYKALLVKLESCCTLVARSSFSVGFKVLVVARQHPYRVRFFYGVVLHEPCLPSNDQLPFLVLVRQRGRYPALTCPRCGRGLL